MSSRDVKIRNPAVAGYFYKSDRQELHDEINSCFSSRLGPGPISDVNIARERKVIGIISPHAGYIYSGAIAAHGYRFLAEDGLPESFIILGPNHTGVGSGVSIYPKGIWRTPLGEVEVDSQLSELIISNSSLIDIDISGHLYEHSVEVQVPFLQYIYELAGKSFKIVPIVLLMQDLSTAKEVGDALAKAILSYSKNVVMIASSDFTHYESSESAYNKDMKVIDRILNLDPDGVINCVYQYRVSMCGYGPVAAVLVASKALGAKDVKLLKYATSGDVTGDKSNVVAYASIVITKE
jgi:hypothetical protein